LVNASEQPLPRGNLRTEKLSELIARQILQDIKRDNLQPGTVLPGESAMCARFGAGRASVREALRILEINGLVTIKTGVGGGPVVAQPGGSAFGQISSLHYQVLGATFRDLIDARVALEPMLAGRAAAQPGPEAGSRLDEALETARQFAKSDDLNYARTHSDFHAAIFAVAGNPVLAMTANALKGIWMSRVTSVLFPEDQRDKVEAAHVEIAAAVGRHDSAEAERLMREHMEHYRQYCELRYPARLDDIVDWS
jgi:GntR family transcriptional regulator, transcriptional repressor for pyruvate dehydrogenase complex